MTTSALQSRPLSRLGPIVVATLCLCIAHAAVADETRVYEWRDANGVVSYSQNPPPPGTKGVTSRVIEFRSLTPVQQAAVKARLAGIEAAGQARSKRFRDEVEAADQKVSFALRRLAQAEQAMRNGREPLAGERAGIAGGGSRLRADYFDRQQQLEDAVQKARAQLEEAYRLRASVTP